MVALLDTNVILTYIIGRDVNDRESCSRVMELCAEGKIKGFVAFHSLSNIWYILHKSEVREKRREFLQSLLDILTVTGASQERVIEAIRMEDFTDFEDCLQYECAKESGAEYIITSNGRDFSNATDIGILTPGEAVALCSQ